MRVTLRTASFLLVVMLACSTSVASAQTPLRRFTPPAVLGAQINPEFIPSLCAKARRDGSANVIAFISRGIFERNNGTLNTVGIENQVSQADACGLDLAVRVTTKTGGSAAIARFPSDIDHYTGLLTQLARYLRGRVDRYAIENEVAAPTHWDGTAEQYFELVRLSAAAIKAGNPDAVVLDGTMASGSMTAVIVADLYARGRYDEALALAQETQANELGGGPPVTNREDLTAYVQSDKVQRFIAFFRAAVANQGSYDAFQLHYYGPWRSLPKMYDFVRAHGVHRPIETWEVAHRYRDKRPFVEREHANEVARLLTVAAGEGSAWTILYSYLGKAENDAIGLLSFDSATEHLARAYFRRVLSKLNGATSAQRLALPGDAWAYAFERPGDDVVVAWSEPRPSKSAVELGIDATTASVRSAGSDRRSHRRLSRLTLDATPRFLTPDLLEMEQSGSGGRKLSERVTLKVSCPRASAGRCTGVIELRSRATLSAKRQQTGRSRTGRAVIVGKARFDVRRGSKKTLTIRVKGRGRAREAVATTSRCPVGKHGCVSWTGLR